MLSNVAQTFNMRLLCSLNASQCRLLSIKSISLRRKPQYLRSACCALDLSNPGTVVVNAVQQHWSGPSHYFGKNYLNVDAHIRCLPIQQNTLLTKSRNYISLCLGLFENKNQQCLIKNKVQIQCRSNLYKQGLFRSVLTDAQWSSKRGIQTKARTVTKKVEQKVKEWQENIMTIPNLLTTSRILLSPVLGYMVLNEYYLLSCGLFIFTGITDMLDGYIARNFKNQQSVLGSILDPLADKLLVGTLMITLCMQELIPVALTSLIISRDIGLVVAGFYYRFKSLPAPFTLQRFFDVRHATVQMQPTFLGKFHTAVTLALLGFTLAAPVFNYVDHSYLQMLRYTTATTTIASGLSYVFTKDTVKFLRKNR